MSPQAGGGGGGFLSATGKAAPASSTSLIGLSLSAGSVSAKAGTLRSLYLRPAVHLVKTVSFAW